MKTNRARLLAVLLALGLVLSAVGHAGSPVVPAEDGLGVYAGNPCYWQYHGRPVLLLGGSSTPPGGLNDEGMFLWPNLPAALDKLKAAGGNYVRCLVSGRLRETVLWPFARKGDRYDLDQWDEEYWRLFEAFLQETQAWDIITDIELWATFDYYREPWTRNPFNPKNNVNYTAEQTGLPVEVPSHPSRAQNTFFRTLPELDDVAVVLKYQQRFVDKILSYTLRHDHVLYCMDNETAVSPKWGAYWARYVRAAAAQVGRKVPVTEMFDPHDLRDPMHSNVIDHPEWYNFVELAQNNHQKGETHYARILEVRRRVAASPRPLNNVKIYGVDGGLFGSTQEAMRRFWRNLFAGCASARFHEKHLGDSEPALRMIRGARVLTAAIDLFRCQPRNDLLRDREPNEAYCLADPGRQYAVYFPAGGSVRLDLAGCAGEVELRWLDVDAARWSGPARRRSVQRTGLDAPGLGQWIAVLTAGPIAHVGVGGNLGWVWRSFLRGHNSIFMDPYDGGILGERFDPKFELLRRNMGYALRYAKRISLAAMTPHAELASTEFCLADPGKEHLVYLPEGGEATVNLSAASSLLAVEWFNPRSGDTIRGQNTPGGQKRSFKPPFDGDAVLYLRR